MAARLVLPAVVRDQVLRDVSSETGVRVDEILAPLKGREAVSHARQEVFWRLRQFRRGEEPAYGWIAIGRAVNRDHTTAMFGYRKVEERRAKSC